MSKFTLTESLEKYTRRILWLVRRKRDMNFLNNIDLTDNVNMNLVFHISEDGSEIMKLSF